jgi:3-dehydro-4-phosphotetronate decarboxylase
MSGLNPAKISKLDNDGNLLSGNKPTKEISLDIAMYEERPQTDTPKEALTSHELFEGL